MAKLNKNDQLKEMAQLESAKLFEQLNTSFTGLATEEAQVRLEEFGYNVVSSAQAVPWYRMLLHALSNPFIFVLAFLAIVSFLTGSSEGGYYMCLMITVSAGVSFVQEYKSQQASIALREMIENTTNVRRNGEHFEIPMDEVVPGDIIGLKTGDMIPADAILLKSKDLFINQSSLTGESFPVEKKTPQEMDEDEQPDWEKLSAVDSPNILFMGTDVLSGTGEILIVRTGSQTMFGDIAEKATAVKNKSAFDIGLSRVSRLLLTLVAIMFPLVFGINWLTKGNMLDAFFFAIAVAVGLTPEMLPMIVNTNLAKGAVALSKEKVIVKQLSAIQNLGSMDILCTDKTGTITEDRVVMMDYVNSKGAKAEEVLNAAFINSNYQTGWKNLMDIAVIEYFKKQEKTLPSEDIIKVDEIPFDFSRRLLSVVVEMEGKILQVTKGAVEEMQDICTHVMEDGERVPITAEKIEAMRAVNYEMNQKGMRVLTVAQKELTEEELEDFDKEDEKDLTLIGFIGFLDPAKESAKIAIENLHNYGVSVKVLTGDNAIVAQKVCEDVGIDAEEYLLGTDIDEMADDELFIAANQINLFAKLNPMQKARIIELLRKVHTVGFMGDGI
ncbi:MAG: magnesium-translocating P-type ATPase, partial [Streptococcaceae bacterium]|nr:magnesium-translocating P-type ATPase [Streptococcaceae bacterium]